MKKQSFDFNFWPSFADIMLALILVLAMFFGFYLFFSSDTWILRQVAKCQSDVINSVGRSFNVTPHTSQLGVCTIKLSDDGAEDIVFVNEPTLQRVRFSTNVLFEKDDYKLKEKGKRILLVVGNQIKHNLNRLREIQIQGHADTDHSRRFATYGNLELGAFRAMAVYRFLHEEIGIDPVQNLMSATSFGEFKPVQREEGITLSRKEIEQMNADEISKTKNRRIELLLFYDYPRQHKTSFK